MFHGRRSELNLNATKRASRMSIDLEAASSPALVIARSLRVVQLSHRFAPSMKHGSPVGRDDLPGHESRIVTR